jgi:predicted alpha/beta hydrolase
VDALEDAVPGLPIVVGGHSLGGQASALYAALHPKRVDAVLLIAACLVDYRLFAGRLRPGLRIAGHLFPAVARLLGSFPGHRFRFGGREARTLMAEWGRVARTGDYRAHGSERDYETALRRAEHELLAVSFSDDSWAPKSAVDGLVNKMPRARARHIHLGRADLGRVTDHFRWARSPEVVAEVVEDWLSDRLEKRDTEVANPR